MMPGLLYLVVQLFRRHCGRVVSLVLTVARHSGGVDKESLNRGRHQHAKRLKQHPYSGKHEGCSVFWSQVCLFVWMFVCLFVCVTVCLILCLFVWFFVCLSVWLFVWSFVCLFVWFFVCLFDSLFDFLFVCLFDSLFVLFALSLYRQTVVIWTNAYKNTRRCMCLYRQTEMIYGLTVGCCGVPFSLILADVHRHCGVGHVYSLINITLSQRYRVLMNTSRIHQDCINVRMLI